MADKSMSTDLTPQQVVDCLREAIDPPARSIADAFGAPRWNMRQRAAALTAALAAYRREHQRRWLEERGVYVARASTGWYVAWGEPAAGITVSLDDYAALEAIETANPYCWSTADEASDAAAAVLGYQGIGEGVNR